MDLIEFLEDNVNAELEKLGGKDSVLIYFGAFNGLDEIHRLEKRLYEEIPPTIGSHDGHEVAMDDSHGTLFTYGNNAETLYKTMLPILSGFDFLNESTVHLTFHKADKTTMEIDFTYERTTNPITENPTR